jgi:hypothetical protein
VAAKPGLLSALDLPLITGSGLVRPTVGPPPDSRLFDRVTRDAVDAPKPHDVMA